MKNIQGKKISIIMPAHNEADRILEGKILFDNGFFKTVGNEPDVVGKSLVRNKEYNRRY